MKNSLLALRAFFLQIRVVPRLRIDVVGILESRRVALRHHQHQRQAERMQAILRARPNGIDRAHYRRGIGVEVKGVEGNDAIVAQ